MGSVRGVDGLLTFNTPVKSEVEVERLLDKEMKRPEFDAFRDIFLGCLARRTGWDPAVLPEIKWDEVGDLEARREVLAEVRDNLLKDYGVEFEVNQRLLSLSGPVESAVIQTFHELNTINLMERIYARMRTKAN